MIRRRLCNGLLIGALLISTAAHADDKQIADLVTAKLSSADPTVARRITVAVQDGVVTLTGKVFTGSQAMKVIQDARAVPGVVKVKNRLSLP